MLTKQVWLFYFPGEPVQFLFKVTGTFGGKAVTGTANYYQFNPNQPGELFDFDWNNGGP